MEKLIISKTDAAKGASERCHLLVSRQVKKSIEEVAANTSRSIFDVTDKLLKYALEAVVIEEV